MSGINYSGQYYQNKPFAIKVRTGEDITKATNDAICGEVYLETGIAPSLYIGNKTSSEAETSIHRIADLTQKVGDVNLAHIGNVGDPSTSTLDFLYTANKGPTLVTGKGFVFSFWFYDNGEPAAPGGQIFKSNHQNNYVLQYTSTSGSTGALRFASWATLTEYDPDKVSVTGTAYTVKYQTKRLHNITHVMEEGADGGKQVSSYLNGELIGHAQARFFIYPADILLGIGNASNISIGDVGFWEDDDTPGFIRSIERQVPAIYNNGQMSDWMQLTQAPWHYWKFGEFVGQDVPDEGTASTNHMTLTGQAKQRTYSLDSADGTNYTFSGDAAGTDPTLNAVVTDTLTFTNNTGGHPLAISRTVNSKDMIFSGNPGSGITTDYIIKGGDITVSAWLKPQASTGSADTDTFHIFSDYTSGGNEGRLVFGGKIGKGWYVMVNGPTQKQVRSAGVGSAGTETIPIANMLDGNWHNLIVTVNGTIAKFFLDGSLAWEVDTVHGIAAGTLPVKIGKSWADMYLFNGEINSISIWETNQDIGDNILDNIYRQGIPNDFAATMLWQGLLIAQVNYPDASFGVTKELDVINFIDPVLNAYDKSGVNIKYSTINQGDNEQILIEESAGTLVFNPNYGEHNYFCKAHPTTMRGVINVLPLMSSQKITGIVRT